MSQLDDSQIASPRSTKQRHADTVIIGGAVMGSALAYFLTEDDSYDQSVAVIEADPTYERASTPLSGGSFRQQFSTALNVKVSQYALDFIDQWHALVEVNGESPELGFVDTGYLFLIDQERLANYQASHEVQRSCGAGVRMLDPKALNEEFSYLNTDGLVAGSLGTREGTLDPWAFMSGFRQRARSKGAEYITGRVVGVNRGSTRPGAKQSSGQNGDSVDPIQSVTLGSGEIITCRRVVNCAGVRANQVAEMVGLGVPVEARSRTSFVFDCRTPIDNQFPLTIDTSGVHVRREGTQYLSGTVPRNDIAVDPMDTNARVDEFEDLIWPALANRIPQFDAINLTSSWGGHYSYNTLDHNMVVGPSPVEDFYFCNGFSGHGLQQAPAVGRGLAELIIHGSYQSLDLEELGYDRVMRQEPVLETNII